MKKIASIFLISIIALAAAFAQETATAVALQKDTALWNEKEPGTMEWAKKDLEPGTVLEVYLGSETDSQGRKRPDVISSEWSTGKKGQKLNFVRANYQGKDYYVIANRVALYQSPAVVTRDAATYLTKNLADVRKTSLKNGTIIAVGEEVSVQGLKLLELSFYDEAQYRIRIGYIKKEKISTKKDDITAMKLLKQAADITDAKRRTAMLDSIGQLSISPSVQDLLDKALEEPEEEEPEVEAYNGEIVTLAEDEQNRLIKTDDGSNLNVRDAPNGNVIGQLSCNSTVTATERTAEAFTSGDLTDYWYHVADSSGTSGWVFGAYCLSIASMDPQDIPD